MTEETIYASYPVFRADPELTQHLDRDTAAKEAQGLLDDYRDRVEMRGVYSTAGFSPTADLMFFWVGRDPDVLQNLLVDFRHTQLGRTLLPREMFLGLVRPAEFAADHLPAFAQGKEPKKYMTVYPYVRTTDWYLLDPSERGKFLRDHGEAGREFPDVWANTTSAFGLGDYEWILCFEADTPVRIVELLRRLRATEARRYTKLEIPFFTGIRKDLAAVVNDLP
ncbi:MAG: hydrogen peroxide-dependent heme synthase [Actinomycetota bacterium]